MMTCSKYGWSNTASLLSGPLTTHIAFSKHLMVSDTKSMQCLRLLHYGSEPFIQWKTFEKENFHKLVKNKMLAEKTFADCLLVSPPKDTTPPNFTEKTFANSYKTSKFAQVFSSKFPALRYHSTQALPFFYTASAFLGMRLCGFAQLRSQAPPSFSSLLVQSDVRIERMVENGHLSNTASPHEIKYQVFPTSSKKLGLE